MKKKVQILVLISAALSLNVAAHTATSPQVCYQRCTDTSFEHEEDYQEWFLAKLKKIQAKKKAETDPEKIKELEAAEQDEIERLKLSLQKTCTKICKYEE